MENAFIQCVTSTHFIHFNLKGSCDIGWYGQYCSQSLLYETTEVSKTLTFQIIIYLYTDFPNLSVSGHYIL